MDLSNVSLEDLKVDGLKKLCREKGLSDKGKKAELLDRLKAYQAGGDAVTRRCRSRSPKTDQASEPSKATATSSHGSEATVLSSPHPVGLPGSLDDCLKSRNEECPLAAAPSKVTAASSYGSGAAVLPSPHPVGLPGSLDDYLKRRNEERRLAAAPSEATAASSHGSGAAVFSSPHPGGLPGSLDDYLKRRNEERRQAAAAAAGSQRNPCPGCRFGLPLPCICGGIGIASISPVTGPDAALERIRSIQRMQLMRRAANVDQVHRS